MDGANVAGVEMQTIMIVLMLMLPTIALGQTIDDVVPRGVSDGDTYKISFRSQGIDTPESKQQCSRNGECYACGEEAKQALLSMICLDSGKEKCKFKKLNFKIWDVGRYGRPVVTAYDGDKDIHLEMLKEGWAVAYRNYLPGPLKNDYISAENEAKQNKVGLWAGEFVMPSKWRKGERLESCE